MSMSTSATGRRSLASALPREVNAIEKARVHAELELANDVPTIMPTVSRWDTNFAVLGVLPDGSFDLKTVFEYEGPNGVEAWYRWQESEIVRHKQYRMNEYNGRWFEFTDQCADLTAQTWSETLGEPIPCHVAVIFATWTDGIIGELAFALPEWGTRGLDEDTCRAISDRFEAYNDAWRRGDVEARLATIEDRTCSVVRIAEVDGGHRHRAVARTKDELRDAWTAPAEGRILELELVQQFTTSWYVFGAYSALVQLPDRQVERETARLLPIGPTGRFIGELSYSLELAVST